MLDLRNHVKHFPHVQRMRKRQRVLRGPKTSRMNELWYKAQLLAIVQFIVKQTEDTLLPLLQQFSPQWAHDSVAVGDGYSTDISETIASMSGKFGGLRSRAKQLATLAAKKSLDSTDAQLKEAIKKSVKIDVTGILESSPIADQMEAAVVTNTDLITSIPDQYLARVRNTVFGGIKNGQRWEDIAASLKEASSITENRAKLIARDQTSKMNASFNQARQTSLNIETYMWAGSMDERERDTHAANEGKIFRWDSPPATTGHPGDDVNCRCTALPVFNLDAQESELGISDE